MWAETRRPASWGGGGEARAEGWTRQRVTLGLRNEYKPGRGSEWGAMLPFDRDSREGGRKMGKWGAKKEGKKGGRKSVNSFNK